MAGEQGRLGKKTGHEKPSQLQWKTSTLLTEIIRWTAISLMIQVCFTIGLWLPKNRFGRKLPNISIMRLFDLDTAVDVSAFEGSLFFLPQELRGELGLTEVLFTTGVVMLLKTIIKPDRLGSFLCFVCFFGLILLDYLRMQTWLYIYLHMFLVHALYFEQEKDGAHEKGGSQSNKFALLLCQMITGGVWMWSGLLKFNPDYPYGDFNFMMFRLPALYLPRGWVFFTAYVSAFFEFIVGFLALVLAFNLHFGVLEESLSNEVTIDFLSGSFPARIAGQILVELDSALQFRQLNASQQRTALKLTHKDILWVIVPTLAVAMHLLIIFRLSQSGYEPSVVPWNFAFSAYAQLALFRARPEAGESQEKQEEGAKSVKGKGARATKMSTAFKKVHFLIVLLLFTILPGCCYFNLVDSYYSFSMYTTNDPAFVMSIPAELNDPALVSDPSFTFPSLDRNGLAAWKQNVSAPVFVFSCKVEAPCTDCVTPASSQVYLIQNHNWGFHDTGSSVHPSIRLFEKLSEEVCLHLTAYAPPKGVDRKQLREAVEKVRFYISDKYVVPYSEERETKEYKCDTASTGRKLVMVKEDICLKRKAHTMRH